MQVNKLFNNDYNEKHSEVKQKNLFNKMRSNYMLLKIFDFLERKILLKLINRNKMIMKRINISLRDYELIYKENYSPIEIEIFPDINQHGFTDKLFNSLEGYEPYYHLYFDDCQIETDSDFIEKFWDYNKHKIILKIDYHVNSLDGLFYSCRSIKAIHFLKFYRTNITNMSFMFQDCKSIKEIKFFAFNTSHVCDMRNMFMNCSSLKALDVSSFDTSNVNNMKKMFAYCSSLKDINLSNFNTSNVKDMSFLFAECSSLISLNITSFDTCNVTRMDYMFFACKKLEQICVSSFNTSKVLNMSNMFNDCISVEMLNLKSFDTTNVENIEGMFMDCISLNDIIFSDFSIPNVTKIKYLFSNCSYELTNKIRLKYPNIPKEAYTSIGNCIIN
jgi:surface protein